MVKARDILYKVSFYLSLAFAILWAVLTAIYLIIACVSIIGGAVNSNSDEIIAGVGFVFAALWFAVMAVCSFINMGLSKKAPVDNTKKTYITSIVFSVLSGTEVGIVGAIFGLILLNQNANAQANNDKVVDAKAEEVKAEEEKPADNTPEAE